MRYFPSRYQIFFALIISLLFTIGSRSLVVGVTTFLIVYCISWFANYMLRPGLGGTQRRVVKRVIRRKVTRR